MASHQSSEGLRHPACLKTDPGLAVFGRDPRQPLAPFRAVRYASQVLDFATCNAARLRRDPDYDGVFFIAVRTTMVYCRPVCRVRQPLTKNVTFYPSAAACERAGYRPCLRCRPEAAPFSPAWRGTRTTVERALRLIGEGALDAGKVAALAGRLGVGTRHLSRLFNEHLGASPTQLARTVRVQRAKNLLHGEANDLSLTLDEIAVRAGFRNVRRMTAAFAALYGRTPAALRRAAPSARPHAAAQDQAYLMP